MNHLAQESSPYLKQHAQNPVDWYPWGEEALSRARREDKPIHLSVGYSACHWCHVMAHESFEDPEVAAFLNEHFVNIKLDREERPDLDQLYQGVVQLMGRGGGWPLTVFLTPALQPFYGGTYFPPEDRHGLPGFPRLLTRLVEAWHTRRAEVDAESEHFKKGLSMIGAYGLEAAPSALSKDDLVEAARRLEKEIDREHGGLGGAPKFPNPACIALLLRGARRTQQEQLSSAALLTLEKMAQGGICDQLGGGFHRYSVDDRWLVPHFEKMLYDNAQLLHLYSEAQQVAPSPLWRSIVEQTVACLTRELRSKEGGFFAAKDADSEGVEGRFFVWTPRQFEEVLGAELAKLACAHFGVDEEGNFEEGASVLHVARTPAQLAEEFNRPIEEITAELQKAREALFSARSKRIAPGLDDKVLAGWNGLAIRGLAMAGRVFGREDWISLARQTADFILARFWVDGRLRRVFSDGRARIDGFMEDYGDVAAGLVAVYQACFEPRYLEAAEAIADSAVELFWDEQRSAYFTAPKGQQELIVSTYALHDGATPSGASSLTEAHVALHALTGRDRHRKQAEKYLLRMRDEAVRNPFGHAHLLLAADSWLEGAASLVIVGAKEARQPFLAAANGAYAPAVALCAIEPGATPALLREALEGKVAVEGRPAAYLCRNLRCEAPMTEAAELFQALSGKEMTP